MSSSTTYLSRRVEKIFPWWIENSCVCCEKKKKHVKYCVDLKQFEQVRVVMENITDSVYQSRKVLAVWSGSYASRKYPWEVPPRILDRGVPPIQGLRKQKLIPFLGSNPKNEILFMEKKKNC